VLWLLAKVHLRVFFPEFKAKHIRHVKRESLDPRYSKPEASAVK